ncbi:hypothetical protein ACLOJK_022737 [Asimina triloba]
MVREEAIAGERLSSLVNSSGLFLSITENDLDNDAIVKESKPEEKVEAPLDEFVKPAVNALEIEYLLRFPLLLPHPHFEASIFFKSSME